MNNSITERNIDTGFVAYCLKHKEYKLKEITCLFREGIWTYCTNPETIGKYLSEFGLKYEELDSFLGKYEKVSKEDKELIKKSFLKDDINHSYVIDLLVRRETQEVI